MNENPCAIETPWKREGSTGDPRHKALNRARTGLRIGALQPADYPIESAEEFGAVAWGERLRPARHFPGGTQRVQEVAGGQRVADRAFGEFAAVGGDHRGACLYAARR